jgi:hypothetical protein
MASLLTLLQCYPIQSSLFSFLRPWDIAIIFYLLQYEPTEAERFQFLNVIDDIFESRKILNIARRNNLQVTLLGKDLNILQSRLVDPHNYYWYRFAKPLRIFVILSGSIGDSGTPNRKYVFELAEDIDFDEAKEEYQFLSKWMRVEPFCTREYVRHDKGFFSNGIDHTDPKLSLQSNFWWNTSRPEPQPSIGLQYKQGDPLETRSLLVSHISTGLFWDLRCVPISADLVKYIASVI